MGLFGIINIMNEKYLTSEQYNEREIIDQVKIAHENFLKLAPGYSKGVWNPVVAIQNKTGSCMSELLYVAGYLLAERKVVESDITIGFSNKHGEEQLTGFIGKPSRKHAHSTMFLTVREGLTIAMDFRANRPDEDPRIQRLALEDIDNQDTYYIGSMADAISRYASDVGDSSITVTELVKLHQEDKRNRQIVFDEEF